LQVSLVARRAHLGLFKKRSNLSGPSDLLLIGVEARALERFHVSASGAL
jgi:hypothetical protein